jgi:hypothetical protein
VALFDSDAPGRSSVEVLSAIPKGIDGREVDVLVAWEFYNRRAHQEAPPEANLALPRVRAALGARLRLRARRGAAPTASPER